MKKFIVINEEFECKNCNHKNSKLKGSCRNHCTSCLYSLHVDENSPGDRESTCKSLMKPIKVFQTGKKGWMILHKCLKCGKEIPNKVAPDDNFDIIIKLSQSI
jgi:hypothetical protein